MSRTMSVLVTTNWSPPLGADWDIMVASYLSDTVGAMSEAATDQLFKPMRSSSSALTQQVVSTPAGPVPNERRRRRPPHGRRTGTTGEWPPATRGSPPAPAEDGPGR